MTTSNKTIVYLGWLMAILLAVISLKNFFGLNIPITVSAVLLLFVAFFLLAEGYMLFSKAKNKILHLFSFAFGLLFLYMAIIMFPTFSAWQIPAIANFSRWIILVGLGLVIAEIYN